MNGENKEVREDSFVMKPLHKYLYTRFELFSGSFMSMKVAFVRLHLACSCSVFILGRKEIKFPFFSCFFFMRVESGHAGMYYEQWAILESSWAYDNIFQGHCDVGWLA
jgi:hypothetical protein